MKVETHTHFADNYLPIVAASPSERQPAVPIDQIEVFMSNKLDSEVAEYEKKGFRTIGTAAFVGRGNQGVGLEARTQAHAVGAALVLFSLTPAKLKTIQRNHQGQIDFDAVLADPPAGFSPRGYSVLRAFFLAKAAANEA
jgi:hypothetical protein